jgi:hypothetical protein
MVFSKTLVNIDLVALLNYLKQINVELTIASLEY